MLPDMPIDHSLTQLCKSLVAQEVDKYSITQAASSKCVLSYVFGGSPRFQRNVWGKILCPAISALANSAAWHLLRDFRPVRMDLRTHQGRKHLVFVESEGVVVHEGGKRNGVGRALGHLEK
jgi:hypothetical protein